MKMTLNSQDLCGPAKVTIGPHGKRIIRKVRIDEIPLVLEYSAVR